ncbi:tape measure protein [Amycolatopsis sp. CA-128772]|uniref:tape measure protein n=1 Tax=Amycolatopsis sp. CA-128772 TaxID=2073159 RepID=UPI000CD20147
MAYSAGAAYVSVLPSFKGFNTAVKAGLTEQLGGLGTQLGAQLGGELSASFVPAARNVGAELESAANRGTAAMTTLARGTAPVLDKLAAVSPILGRVRDGFTTSEAAVSAFSGTAGTLGGKLRTVVDVTNETAAGFGKMGKQADTVLQRVGSRVQSAVTAPVRAAGDALGSFGLSAGSAFTVAGVAAVTMGIKFNASQESATMAFTTMLHSATQARDFMAQLTQFAAQTPFDLPGVTSAAQKLMAFGFQARDVLPTLTAIGDAVSGLGGSTEAIERVTTAIGQMSAKGKVQSDEILQLTEAGIPALRILANQYGVTTGAMQDMVTKGLVPSSEAVPKLLQGIERGTSGAAGETTAFAGMMSQQATTITGVWSNFVDNFNRAMGNLMAPAMPGIKSALTWLTTQLGTLPGWFERVRAVAAPVFAQLVPVFQAVGSFVMTSVVPALRNLWTAVQPVVVIVGGALLAALRLAGSILSTVVGPALVAVSGWVRPLMPIVVGIAAAFAGWFAIGLAVTSVVRAVALLRTVIVGVTVAWRILSLAFSISPIGAIITLVAALVAGVIYAWTHFEGFRNVVLTAWSAIQTAASFTWNSILKPAFDGIVTAVKAVGSFFSWLWGIVSPILSAIGLAARILAAIIITVVVTPIVLAFKVWAAIMTWLYNTIVKPIIDLIAAIFVGFYNLAIKPIVDLIVLGIRAVGAVIDWLWPVFQRATAIMGAVVAALYNIFIKPYVDGAVALFHGLGWVFGQVADGIQWALGKLGDFFSWIGGKIHTAWDAVGNVVRSVYTDHIKPYMDKGADAVHWIGNAFDWAIDHISKIWDQVKGIAAKPVNFIIDFVYNKGIRAVWNWVADLLGLGKLAPAGLITFAGGGVLDGFAPGRDVVPSLLSPGEAVLVPELVRQIGPANIIAANAAASNGRPATVVGGGRFAGGGIARFAGGGVVSDLLGFIGDIGSDVVDMFSDPVGWIGSHIGAGASQWVSMLAKMPATLIDKSVTWLWDKITDWINPFSSSGGGGGNASLAGWIAQAMALTGVPANWAGPLNTLIMRESGGNPRAINLWDSNAQAGHPSQGLMQTIPGTFAAYRDPRLPNDIYNPVANIVAGINYIRSRYGSIFNVQQAVGSTPKGYDSGGWLPPGYSTVYNGTGRPEAVFTADQFDVITAAASGSVGGEFSGVLVLDSGEFLGVVRGEIAQSNDALGTAIATRTRI